MRSILPSLWRQPYLLLSLAALFWASNAVVGRAVAALVPPATLAELRWIGAFLLVLPFAWRQMRRDWPVVRRRLPLTLLLSLTGVALFNAMLYWSLHHTSALNATLMQSSAPLLIGLWSFLLYRDPLSLGQLAGILVSLAGVAVIVSEGNPAALAGLAVNVGDLVVVLAMAVYALYSALLRRRPAVGPLAFAGFTMGFGAVLLLPLFLVETAMLGRAPAPTPSSVLAIAYVAIFPSVLAYLAFNRGIELIGPNRAGPFFHLIPLFGAGLAMLLLDERPALFHAAGAFLILAGVVAASRPGRGGGNRVAPGAGGS